MKYFLLLSSLFIGGMFVSPTESQSQWQPDVRLTNDPAFSFTGYRNNAWRIGASGTFVHVVWYDNRELGNTEIYYKRSTDRGVNWGVDTRLTNSLYFSESPSIAVSGSVVHVVWQDYRDGSYEIYYKRSTDAGASWGADRRLTGLSGYALFPSVAVSGSVVHVVWQDDDPSRNIRVYYKRSTDAGVTWGGNTRLTSSRFPSRAPSVAVSSSVVHVVWYDDPSWTYYKRSTDAGVSWSVDTRLSNNTAYSWLPSVTASGSVVHAVWNDYRSGSREIFYKHSTDGGVNWSTDTRLTTNSYELTSPSATVFGSVVHVVWDGSRDGNEEIYYKRSTDGGVNWGTEIRLTNDTAHSRLPSVTVSGSAVHVIWSDDRDGSLDGNYEIYYKRDPTGNLTGVESIGSEFPVEFSLKQNYPNPFNPETKINFQVPTASDVELKIFDLLGREVATLVNERMNPGTYSASWDATGFASGVYLYRMKAGSFVETKKLLLLR